MKYQNQLEDYINIQAARKFVDRLVSDQALRTYTLQDEQRARAILMETDLANGDHNILRGDPSIPVSLILTILLVL